MLAYAHKICERQKDVASAHCLPQTELEFKLVWLEMRSFKSKCKCKR